MNAQLKIINMTLNTMNEDIKKNNAKLEKILNDNNNDDEFKNIIINKILIYILLYFMGYKSYKFYF